VDSICRARKMSGKVEGLFKSSKGEQKKEKRNVEKKNSNCLRKKERKWRRDLQVLVDAGKRKGAGRNGVERKAKHL